ncbi:WGR domain-containing protein [Pararhizobium arenae]|uniref:WGR domain-containing protein n=1 Tax=Pararhizobium arenae TaxID=1856850 RepID=UPI00094ACFE0|nr:WGR domain-containing protein [Pararhizobium arenae]
MNTRFDICIYKVNTVARMARFYRVAIEPSLLDGFIVVRRWGRIGTYGRTREQHFKSERDAMVEFLLWLRRKRARGYAPMIAMAQNCVGNRDGLKSVGSRGH